MGTGEARAWAEPGPHSSHWTWVAVGMLPLKSSCLCVKPPLPSPGCLLMDMNPQYWQLWQTLGFLPLGASCILTCMCKMQGKILASAVICTGVSQVLGRSSAAHHTHPKVGKCRCLLFYFMTLLFFICMLFLLFWSPLLVACALWTLIWDMTSRLLSSLCPSQANGHISHFTLSTAKLFLALLLLLEGTQVHVWESRGTATSWTIFVSLWEDFPLVPSSPTRENMGVWRKPLWQKWDMFHLSQLASKAQRNRRLRWVSNTHERNTIDMVLLISVSRSALFQASILGEQRGNSSKSPLLTSAKFW